MSPGEIIPWVLAALGVLSFLATATVLIVGAKDQGVKKTQKDSIEALLEFDRIKDRKIAELEASDKAKTARIEVLENLANSGDKIDAMRQAVLEAITTVNSGLGEHNTVALERIDGLLGALNQLPKGIAAELAAEIVKAMKGTP